MKVPIVILFLTCLILVSGQSTKYDFLSLGCYSTPSTFTFNAMTAIGVIAKDDPMSWPLCARNCQFQNYQYAALKTTECFCSNSINAAHKVDDSFCSTPCAGDSSEKCGASSYQNVLDLSTVIGTICPSNVFAEEGSLCCPERASFKLIDQSLLDFLDSLFPPVDFSKYSTGNGKLTEAQLAQRAAYLNSQISPNVWFVTEGSISISVVGDGAGYRNQMGYFLIDSNSKLPIDGTWKDVFGDMSWDSSPNKNPSTLKYKSCVPRLGLTATIGPFPPGTGVGFFLHANGASAGYISSDCRKNNDLKNCLIKNGARSYECYRNNECSIDAAKGSVTPAGTTLYTWTSIDSLNLKDKVKNRRHVALIDTSYGVVLGFEDMFDLGDQDYNDAMFLLSVTGDYSGNFPILCNPSCNELNGKCNYNTGTCQCNSAPGVTLTSTCDCQSACTKCTSGGVCRCSDKKCICKDGFKHSPAGNDCACSTVVGTCYGSTANFDCGVCNCNAGYTLPATGGPNTGIYLYSFGLSTTTVTGDYVLATGAVIGSSTSFGSFGWDTDHTSQAVQFSADGQPNSSIIKMKRNAQWTVYLKPNWNYDVSVTMGSQSDSNYNLNVVSGSTTYTLANNLALGVNQYVEKTVRVTTGSDGKIVLQEANTADSTTRLTSAKIAAAPCSCLSCPSGGCGTGKCNCYTGQCECPTGFTGSNCQQCLAGYYGPSCLPCPSCGQGTCSDGKSGNGGCTCKTGWVSNGGNCNTCATGYFGSSCTVCPACVTNQGSCNAGISGNGQCTCKDNFAGTLCNECKANSGGSSCTTCPTCTNGVCSTGITGTGKCNCNTGWVQGSTGTSTNVNSCDACAAGYWGNNCQPCPNCDQGTCNAGINGNGQCTCYTGWTSSGGNCNACAAGYYGPNCAQCGSTCATCSTANSCDTCKSNLLYNNGQCVSNCPSGTYQSGTQCLTCDNSCSTCSGALSNQCTSCPSGKYLQEGVCVSSCSTGFYVSGSNCLPCQSPCTTCQTSATTCTSCSGSNNLYNSQCITTCPAGTFSQNNVCQPCNSNCATCSGSATNCQTCSGNLALSGSTCVSTCPNGTWKNGNVCSPCDSTCATCNGASNSNCLTCPSHLVQQGSTCISSCNNGYYQDSNKICQSCQNPCKTCSNSATHCDSCVNGFNYDHVTFECKTICDPDQYQVDNSCHNCNPTCATCNGGSSSNCLSCPSGYLQNNVCVSQCDTNYYISGTNCLPCDSNCATCSGSATNCLSCSETQLLQNNVCVGTCNTNYYVSGTNCLPCDNNCATCQTSSTTCTSCSGSLALSGSTCVSTCPDGTWKNGNVCSNCNTCATCSGSATTCTSCSGSLALSGTSCVSTCPDGTYKNGNTCSPCDSTCATCSGGSNSNCLTCPSHLVQQGSTCISSCNNGYYQDSNRICQSCDDNCLTCSGSSTTCTSCQQTSGATHLQDTTCVINCDSNRYVDSNGDCIPCHSTCTTCNGGSSSNCSSCSGSLFLDVNQCSSTCSDSHQYANTATNKCEECDSRCLTCTGSSSNQCSSCPAGTSALEGTTCVSKCPDGKYVNSENNRCENCFFNCKTCTSGSGQYECTSCSESLSLSTTGACVSTCPDGYYSLNNVCEKCDETCQTCSQGPSESSSNCLTCPPSTYFLNGNCLTDCPKGYYNYEDDIKYCHQCATPRPCANGGVADCVTGNCDCTGTGFSGALCTCSEAQCPSNSKGDVCSNNAPCTCSECQCDPARYFGSACECKQCPGVTPCSGKGNCSCDGICQCNQGYVGLDCSIKCTYDACGVCFGDGSSCAGCDGISNSNKVFDACDVCGGDNSTCSGCDGVPNSKKRYDVCGVCNGDGSSCKDRLACESRDSCGACNQGIGSANLRLCVWCNSTQSCMLLSDKNRCVSPLDTCSTDTPTAPAETDQFTSNESNNTGVIVGAVLGCVVAAAAIGALVYMVKTGKGPLNFEPPLLEDNPAAYNNPLYQEYSPGYDNPIYIDPKK